MDYNRIEKAILFLQSHFLDQPELATVARHVHLSEYHFQRLFSRWAGISPKRFLQCLTVDYAKCRLAESRSVLDVTFDAGLSSPGRLHDMFVSVEAITPGEFKTRGAGLKIRYGLHPTPFGQCLLAVSDRGICSLAFVDHGEERAAVKELRRTWSAASCDECPEATGQIAARIFEPLAQPQCVGLGLFLVGTNFQVQVWKALLRIPPGALVSYDTVSEWIGRPTASRAVAQAIAHNPIACLIPCHRVIRKTGVIGDYHWGCARKRAMLAWESNSLIESNTACVASYQAHG